MQRIWDWLLNLQRVRLGEGELTVRLTNLWPAWLALLATAAVIAGVIFIYRRDGGSRAGKIIGATLRCALLVLLLLLIWQPVIRIERTRREPGVVAVMVDTSASMATPDRYAADDPCVLALAKLAGLTTRPDSQPDGQADPALRGLAEGISGQARIDLVRKALDEKNRKVLDTLMANNDVVIYGFAQSAGRKVQLPQKPKEGDSSALQDPGKAPVPPVDAALAPLNELKPDGLATSLGQAIGQVLGELRGQRLAGVIVLSDGRSTVESDLDAAVEQAHKFRVPAPIHTVAVGSIHPPRDLSVNRVVAEPVVFVRDLVAVKAVIGQHGYDQPERVVVRLLDQKTERELARQTVAVGEPDKDGKPRREVETELRYQPEVPGVYQLAVRVEPGDGGDLNAANNTSVAQVEVKDAQIRVLLIDGWPRWEFRYVKNSLLREKTVVLSTMLMSADENFAQEGKAPITRLPVTADEWNRYDVIIMGDVSPLDMTSQQFEDIEAFVRDRGGGFALIAGEQFAPQRYAGTPLARLLPVEIDPAAGPDRINRTAGFSMRLTPDGKRSPILRFERLPERNEETIKAFPEFYWFKSVLALKPGAEVLAEHPTAVLPSGEPAPLLVCGRYGAGKTYFSAVDATWRWRWNTGVPFFDTYWLQTVRWLSRNKLLQSDRRFELSAAQSEYDLGQPVEIALQVLDKTIQQLPDTVAVVVCDHTGRPIDTIQLRRAGTSSYLYSLRYLPPTEGDFSFSLDRGMVETVFGAGPAGSVNASMPRCQIHVALASHETEQLAIDTDSLNRLAGRTGGQAVTLASLEQVAAAVPDMHRLMDDDLSLPLWDTRLALILFAMIVTAEWIVRKKNNLQ